MTPSDDAIELHSCFLLPHCVQIKRDSVLYTILTQGLCAIDFTELDLWGSS